MIYEWLSKVYQEIMNPKTRQQFIFLHVLLAGFFLPAAVMFSITGGLYTFGIKGDYKTQTLEVAFPTDSIPNLDQLIELAKNQTQTLQLNLPTGEPSLKKVGTSWIFEWTGSQRDITIEPTATIGLLKLSNKETTWHRYFVQLHKAKGGFAFKVMAGLLAVAFLSLFLSGIMMSMASPKLKRALYFSSALGFVAFVGLALLS